MTTPNPPVSLVRSHERTSDDRAATPGMHRQLAYDRDGAWVGVVHTESGVTSGWHHHGDWDTYVYIASGAQRVEFGGGGQENLLAGRGTSFMWRRAWCTASPTPRQRRRRPSWCAWAAGLWWSTSTAPTLEQGSSAGAPTPVTSAH